MSGGGTPGRGVTLVVGALGEELGAHGVGDFKVP